MGVTFSTSVQTSPGAHPASYTMDTGWFPRVKQLLRGINHSPPSSTKVKERVKLHFRPPTVPSWQVIGWNLPFPFNFQYINSSHQQQKNSSMYCYRTEAVMKCLCIYSALPYIHTQYITWIQNSAKVTLNPLYTSDNKDLVIFRHVHIVAKSAYLLCHVYLCTCFTPAPTGHIVVKFDNGDFYKNLSSENFFFKSDNNIGLKT